MEESIPITDFKDIRRLRTERPQNRDPSRSESRTIYGFDTETSQGNIFLIADSDGNFVDEISPKSVLEFLFSKKYQKSWNFVYNLGYDAEVILKLLGKELNRYKRTRQLVFEFGKYKLTYIPGKCLRITKGHHSVSFFDIAQFYDRKPLDVAYQENIAKLNEDYLELKKKRKQFSIRFYNRNKKLIRNYCIQDCKLTKELAENWIKLFHDAFGFYSVKWFSSGYLAEKVLINNGIAFPKFDSIPFEVQDLAYRSYFGGRFEMTKRGFIGKAFLYDINSAYPYAITQIPDLNNGRWIKRKSIHPKAKLGFFEVLADIPDDTYIPPFAFRVNNEIIFPTGKFITYCTLAELQACKNPNWYKILNSWQFVPGTDTHPYAEFIQKMYQKRLKLKQNGDAMQLPLKVILNSIYGKTGQKVNRIIGNLFNPVIFSFITGFARAQLYCFVTENKIEKEIVAFATDSICVRKDLGIDSSKLGEFHLDKSGNDVYYLQNGLYRFNGKWKQRGLGNLGSKEIEEIDTMERQGKLYAKFKVLRSKRLRSAILEDKLDEIGKIKEITREVNLNADRKRLWLGQLKAVDNEFNDSASISLNHFTKNQI
jgi:hypothetical protein